MYRVVLPRAASVEREVSTEGGAVTNYPPRDTEVAVHGKASRKVGQAPAEDAPQLLGREGSRQLFGRQGQARRPAQDARVPLHLAGVHDDVQLRRAQHIEEVHGRLRLENGALGRAQNAW